MAEQTIQEGGCLCGAVRFKAEGEPLNVRVCHCRLCQKAMGSPFFARAQFDQRAVTVEGETAGYRSSEAIERVFCRGLRYQAILAANQRNLDRGRAGRVRRP